MKGTTNMKTIKKEIIDSIIEQIEKQIKHAEKAKLDAIEESKAHKGAMESRYDTFKEEAQYLAGAYESTLLKLNKMLQEMKSIKDSIPDNIDKVSTYAIVEVENINDGSRVKYFFLPVGGGNKYKLGEEIITILNVEAPLARAFIGATVGDEVEIELNGIEKIFRIISII